MKPAGNTPLRTPDSRQHPPLPCAEDANFLVTNYSGKTVGDARTHPVAPSHTTRAYCQQHAAENAVNHRGLPHSIPLDSAADRIIRNVRQLQLARRLTRNLQPANPAPYPQPAPFETSHDSGQPSVDTLRVIQSRIAFFLRPSHLCIAPLCYERAGPATQTP